MKIYKISFKIFVFLSIIFFICSMSSYNNHASLFFNISTGLFTGSVVVSSTSLIGYFVVKHRINIDVSIYFTELLKDLYAYYQTKNEDVKREIIKKFSLNGNAATMLLRDYSPFWGYKKVNYALKNFIGAMKYFYLKCDCTSENTPCFDIKIKDGLIKHISTYADYESLFFEYYALAFNNDELHIMQNAVDNAKANIKLYLKNIATS